MNKEYLGEAVYVEISPFGDLVLTTEDGIPPAARRRDARASRSVTNMIVLEAKVWGALTEYVGRIKGEAAA